MRRWAALFVLLLALSAADAASAKVAKPRFVRHIDTGETGWFSSPGLVDLTGDKKLEIVAPFYSTFVYSAKGRLLGKGTATEGRVYAPGVVADLDGDGVKEIVVGGNDGTVAAYDLGAGGLTLKPGWPASTCSGGQCPETRGLAAADLDRDGRVEVVATTTNTSDSGSQVFVFTANGANAPGWPRYSAADATFNGVGNQGYGAYGENVGIGQLDDDRQLEVVVTFDNHQINLFNHDGTSVLASPWYTNRQSGRSRAAPRLGPVHPLAQAQGRGRPLPPARRRLADINKTPWLQWTASPPSIGDLDRDGKNEVIGVPNVEKKEPYETQAYAFMVLDGAYGKGARSARRHKGFNRLPLTSKPAVRPDGDWYPPSGIPAPTLVNLRGNRRPEIVAPIPDGRIYAISPKGKRLWRYDYAHGRAEDVRVRGRRRRPQPRRPQRARLRRPTAWRPTRAASSCSPPRARSSTTSASATRARTATGSASPRHPRSRTSTTTASSRSWSPRSTTASTSTASSAPTRSRCRGRPGAGTCCATARVSRRLLSSANFLFGRPNDEGPPERAFSSDARCAVDQPPARHQGAWLGA